MWQCCETSELMEASSESLNDIKNSKIKPCQAICNSKLFNSSYGCCLEGIQMAKYRKNRNFAMEHDMLCHASTDCSTHCNSPHKNSHTLCNACIFLIYDHSSWLESSQASKFSWDSTGSAQFGPFQNLTHKISAVNQSLVPKIGIHIAWCVLDTLLEWQPLKRIGARFVGFANSCAWPSNFRICAQNNKNLRR